MDINPLIQIEMVLLASVAMGVTIRAMLF